MSDPFLGEIRIHAFDFAPRGWALCNGQLLPINQNQAVFALLGTTYGGNGQTTFALPDLRGRVPLHFGPQNPLGARSGQVAVTLATSQLPPHTHAVAASAEPASSTDPGSAVLAKKRRFGANAYAAAPPNVALAASAIGSTGGSQPHENRQPYTALSFCIALQGIFPSRN